MFDPFNCVAVRQTVAVAINGGIGVGFDHQFPVALRMQEDLLTALLVFKPQFVKAAATGRGEGFEHGTGFMRRQRIRMRIGAVIDAA